MKSKGNGSPERCTANLLSIIRGEVPYERLKGVGATAIDSPASRASISLEADAQWLLQTYEPRVDVNKIDVNSLAPESGTHLLNADITIKREEGANGGD